MRWKVTGADAKTGRDVVATFDAPDAGAAEQMALYNGVLVSSVEKDTGSPTRPQFLPSQPKLRPSFVAAPSTASETVTYKVLTQKDKWFSQKFDPSLLEAALNSYASQGWRACAADTASFPGAFTGYRQELIAVLERGEERTMFEYKVLTQKDKWFSGKFDPQRLEAAINSYAQQGWRVVIATTASFPGFFSSDREELILVMERSKH